jgi:nucleotide-binding universal stress UspA family protein
MAAIRTLLVPVDGSPGGALAVGAALGLARATHAKIVLVQVVVPLMAYALGTGYDGVYGLVDPGWDEEARAAANEYVEGLANRLVRAGVSAEGRVVDAAVGSPSLVIADALGQAAGEMSADMIVMSTHALTGPARTALGSVADAVVRGSHRPVMLMRRGRPLVGSHAGSVASVETA